MVATWKLAARKACLSRPCFASFSSSILTKPLPPSGPWKATDMAKTDAPPMTPTEAVISVVGPGMTVEGDCETDGSLRIEGTIRGDVRAGKSVVIGKGGLLEGNIYTQDAVVGGRVLGAVYAESRLELQATSKISGEIRAGRIHVEVGAALQGQMAVGEGAVVKSEPKPGPAQEP